MKHSWPRSLESVVNACGKEGNVLEFPARRSSPPDPCNLLKKWSFSLSACSFRSLKLAKNHSTYAFQCIAEKLTQKRYRYCFTQPIVAISNKNQA